MPFYFNAVPFCPILLFPQRSEPVCLYHSSFVVTAAMMLIIPRVHHTRRHPHCHRCPRPHDSKVTSEHSLSTLWMIAWLHLKCRGQGEILSAPRPALFKLASSNKGLYWGHRFKCYYAENSSQCQPEATQLGKNPWKGPTVASNWSGVAVQWSIAAKKREFISRDTSQERKEVQNFKSVAGYLIPEYLLTHFHQAFPYQPSQSMWNTVHLSHPNFIKYCKKTSKGL